MSDFALFRYFEMTERKREQFGAEQAKDDDVMVLAAELDRGMEGQRDWRGGWNLYEKQLLGRGGQAGLQSTKAAASQQLADNNSEAW